MGRFDVDEKLFLSVVDRGWWGELTPNKDDMVVPEHPFVYVRFTWDDVDRGDNPDIVGALMKWEERMMKEEKLPDVPYNFMIGDEGIVYEGRGWHMDADRPLELVTLTGRSLDIAYLGDFSKKDPSWEMQYAAHNLILYALKEKYLWEEFRVIPYNRERTKQFV